MAAEALVIACKNGNTKIVSDLLQSGVSVDSLDQDGFSGLLAATANKNIETIKLLLHHGAQVDLLLPLSALMIASTGEIAQLLLDHGAQVDLQDNEGKTALMNASKSVYTKVVRVLLNNNAQVNLQDCHGMTALMHAICDGNIELVKLLLENGAQVDLVEESRKQTALILASLVNHIEIVQLLLDYRAQVNWSDKDGRTALIHVATHEKGATVSDHFKTYQLDDSDIDYEWSLTSLGSTEMIKFLLDHGAEVNLQDIDGMSALMAASSARNIEAVQLLLEHGAQVHLVDQQEKSALAYASAADCSEIVHLLITPSMKQNDTTTSATGQEGESELTRSKEDTERKDGETTSPKSNEDNEEVTYPPPARATGYSAPPHKSTPVATKPKNTITLKAVCNALSTVSQKWYKIGIQLGIPRHKLEEFKKEDDPLSTIIDFWLKGNIKDVKDATVACNWATLVSVLQTDYVHELGVAERVYEEHCTESSPNCDVHAPPIMPTITPRRQEHHKNCLLF